MALGGWTRVALYAGMAAVLTLSQSVPGVAQPALVQAAQEARQGRWGEVIALLRPLANLEGLPGGRASLLMGYALLKLGLPRDAAEALEAAAQQHSLLSDFARFLEGEAWMAQGRFPEAIQSYREVVAVSPQTGLVARASLRLGESLVRAGAPQEAVPILMKALRSPGGEKDKIWFLLGQSYEAMGRPKEALNAYVSAWRAFPGSVYESLAEARIRSIEKSTGLQPAIPVAVRFQRAMGFLNRGDLKNAEKAFQAVLTSNPSHEILAESLYRLGRVQLYLGDPKGASRVLARGAALGGPWRDAAMYWQAVALLRVGRQREGMGVYQALVQKAPASLWAGRALLAMAALETEAGRLAKADEALAQVAGRFGGSLRWEATWRRGWLRLRQGKYMEAERYFTQLSVEARPAVPLHGQQASRGFFWAAQSASQRGDSQKALDRMQHLAKTFPLTYYGQRARAILELPPVRFQEPSAGATGRSPLPKGNLQDLPQALKRVQELAGLGLVQEAIWEAGNALDVQKADRAIRSLLAEIYDSLGHHRAAIALVEGILDWSWNEGEQPNRGLWELAYPFGFRDQVVNASQRFGLDPRLVLAVIREESRFDPQAVSPAGAVGLMQVLPSTGARMAEAIGLPQKPRLTDPETNILLGAAYLGRLLERFDGNVAVAIAGYNAGPGAVSRWRERFQDPKSTIHNSKSELRDGDWFIETIPYMETREYVKRVLESYGIYQALWP